VYDGRRAKVDVRNPAVVRALKLDGRTPRPVSRALLDALPEVPAIALPAIAGAGAPSVVRGLSVGTVFRSIRADTTEYYVALTFGVQRIGQVAADLIRFAQPGGTAQLVTVAPSVIGGLPIIEELPVSTFPDRSAVTDRSALCAQWTPGAKTAVLTGDSLPVMPSVSLAQADGDGPDVDSVRIPPGRSAYIRAVGVSGAGAGFRFLVTDAGVVFGIHDDDAATRLGLTEPPRPAPWPVLARLPRGPELSVQAASVVRDSVGSPS
jgi:type VII secretion protein EccB